MSLFKKENLIHVADQVGYFIVAVVIINSVGLWLPYVLDWFNRGAFSATNREALPSNIVTYFGGIAAVGMFDRMRAVFKMERHPSKTLEFSVWVIIVLSFLGLILYILKQAKEPKDGNALEIAAVSIILSYVVWWIANYKPLASNPLSPLGGDLNS